jgi:MYXO-CTERM domain-containing protein
MRRLSTFALSSLAALALASAPAQASPVQARLSSGGVEFIEDELPSLVPPHVDLPPQTFTLYSCPGDDATFTQRNTGVDVYVDALDLSLPSYGTMRVDLTFSAFAAGEAYLSDIYACLGTTTCDDYLDIYGARIIADFTAWVGGEDQQVHADLTSIDFQLSENDIYVMFDGCAPDDVFNFMVDLAKEWALQKALEMAEDIAREKFGPKMEEMLEGVTRYTGSVGSADFDARLTDIQIAPNGIGLGADVDLSSPYPAAPCISSDPGDPLPLPGTPPDLASGIDAHLGVAVNLGLMDDALYQVWREGFMCVTPETLTAFGVDLDLSIVTDFLPGFPAGTTFSMQAFMADPPTMRGSDSDAAKLTMQLRGFAADLIATYPDGSEHTLHLDMDASVDASIQLDPTINALTAGVDGVTIERLEIIDELGLAELGFDFERIRSLMQDRVMPRILSEMGRIPVTGPVFGGIANTYLILREVRTTEAYVYAKADLFRAPEFDYNSPDTFIAQLPEGPVNPAEAKLLLDGADAEIPSQLLQYRVAVDGVSADPTYVRQVKVGVFGQTKSYHVEARAIDLAGNEDASPASADVLVDGVLPDLEVLSALRNVIDTASPEVSWQASDDLTPADRLEAKIIVYVLPEEGQGGQELVGELAVPRGRTSMTIDLDAGVQYRVVLNVVDEAGNLAGESMIFTVSPDAGGAGCGCTTAPAPSGSRAASALLLLAAAAILIGIRRRSR